MILIATAISENRYSIFSQFMESQWAKKMAEPGFKPKSMYTHGESTRPSRLHSRVTMNYIVEWPYNQENVLVRTVQMLSEQVIEYPNSWLKKIIGNIIQLWGCSFSGSMITSIKQVFSCFLL